MHRRALLTASVVTASGLAVRVAAAATEGPCVFRIGFKLIESAQTRRRAVNAPHLVKFPLPGASEFGVDFLRAASGTCRSPAN
jgi:hypothetical protein